MASLSSRLRAYFATAGYSQPGERKLVRKIDFFILSFCCLSYFLNYVSLSVSRFHAQILMINSSAMASSTAPTCPMPTSRA